MERVCSPRAESDSPQVAHVGRSPEGIFRQSSLSPICTKSWSSWTRTWFICSSTAASISAHVAFGCSFRHWVIPSRSPSAALTCCICSLRCRLFFLAFMLSSLSPRFFLLVYHLPPFCQKMNRTRHGKRVSRLRARAFHPHV